MRQCYSGPLAYMNNLIGLIQCLWIALQQLFYQFNVAEGIAEDFHSVRLLLLFGLVSIHCLWTLSPECRPSVRGGAPPASRPGDAGEWTLWWTVRIPVRRPCPPPQ